MCRVGSPVASACLATPIPTHLSHHMDPILPTQCIHDGMPNTCMAHLCTLQASPLTLMPPFPHTRAILGPAPAAAVHTHAAPSRSAQPIIGDLAAAEAATGSSTATAAATTATAAAPADPTTAVQEAYTAYLSSIAQQYLQVRPRCS